MLPWILHMNPGPSAVIQAQIMTEPPPCLTVCLTCRSWSLSVAFPAPSAPVRVKTIDLGFIGPYDALPVGNSPVLVALGESKTCFDIGRGQFWLCLLF